MANWRETAKGPGVSKILSKKATSAARISYIPESTESDGDCGGLDDEEDEGEAPVSIGKIPVMQRRNDVSLLSHLKLHNRSSSHRTKTVAMMISKSDKEIETLETVENPKARRPTVTTTRKFQLVTPKPTQRARKAKSHSRNTSISSLAPVKSESDLSVASGSAHTASTSTDDHDLPAFIQNVWKTRYLPTLNHCLGSSKQPWDLATVTGEKATLTDTFQEVLDAAIPGNGYKVDSRDKISIMVQVFLCVVLFQGLYLHGIQSKQRLDDKRAFFGRQALKVVGEHFKTKPFIDNPEAIAKYATWAARKNGPGIFAVPTPIDCIVNKTSPDYIVSFIVVCTDYY